MTSQLSDRFKQFEHFCKSLIDAYAVLDASGKVVKCNQLLTPLVGKKSKQILKERSLDNLLSLSIGGQRIEVSELMNQSTPRRIDEVSGATESDPGLNLILGYYPFLNDQNEVIGCFLLIRDVTAETNLQDKYRDKADQSIKDRLTGLHNRAYFDQLLPKLLKDIDEGISNNPLCIMMSDIDFFKKINDSYGHLAGDFILAQMAGIFRKNFRKSDAICRYGGEEFIGIFQSSDLTGAAAAADGLRKTIQDHTFDFEGTIIPVTISIGIAQYIPGKETMSEVMARADAALYYSKDSGRNKVSIHQNGKIR